LTAISDQDRLCVMHDVILYRIDAAKNMWRYYRLDLQPDLFGLWLLVKEWGRVGQHGQTRVTSFATVEEASLALQRQRDAKQKRGYSFEPQAR
jgi:predicted DNA-binding WGR domain protein